MKRPRDFQKAAKRFQTFHAFEPRDAAPMAVKIPVAVFVAGPALWVAYRSDKWTGKPENYIHEHETGVTCYRPDGDGARVEVPAGIRAVGTLVRLGDCLGFAYNSPLGEVEAAVRAPYPELYCTPDGAALLVIEAKHTLHAIIWGGYLDVAPEGIKG